MSVDLPNSIIGEYFDAITKTLESNTDRKETAILFRQLLLSKEYGFSILMSLAEIDSLHKEIRIIFRGFEPRNVGLFMKALTVEDLILSVKFYVISWTTLLDMLAALISKVFNLGFADSDVKFGLILRNKHVLNSDLPAIFKKYSKALDITALKRHRNEIVHRGKIMDEEVKSHYKAKNILDAERYSLLRSAHISEEEYKKESARQIEVLFDLASRKKATYEAHYKTTLEMIAEVLDSLGRKAVELHKPKAI